jgi:hypothetical protein
MRESASLASSLQRRQLPAGLMQRLEMMQHLALQAQAEGQSRNPLIVQRISRPSAQVGAQLVVLAWFSLGVMTTGAAGVGALVGLRALEARGTPLTWTSLKTSVGATWSAAWAKMPALAFARRPAPRAADPWERVEIKIDRSQRARAPLGLSVMGDGRLVHFVLDGLPEGVRPSRGAMVGTGTWVVASADIEGLHLTLDQGAPDAFDLKIALLVPSGVAKSGSLVQVRLVDETAPLQAAAEPAAKAGVSDNAKATEMPVSVATATAKTPGARTDDKQPAKSAAPAPADNRVRPWPEGASGLGAKARDADAKSGQSWWSASPSKWSPFGDGK